MLQGIIIFEQGGAQVVGELNSFAGIIATIKQILPELEHKEAQRVLSQISDEELKQIVAARENAAEVQSDTGKTKKL